MKEMKETFRIIYEAFKISIVSLFYEKPKPMWIAVNLYSGDQLIDTFKVCPEKGRVVISESRTHNYKIKTEVLP